MARKYIISYDVRIPGIVEIEAESDEDALEKFYERSVKELRACANTESADIIEDSVNIEDWRDDG